MSKRMLRVSSPLFLALALLLAGAVAATDLEQEARAIEALLIAPCCFSQQVSVHQSPAADQVRRDIRRRLAAGETRQRILDAYVAQYGPRVLAEPPARGSGRLLYVLPPLAFLLTAGWVIVLVRRLTHSRANETAPSEAPTDAHAYSARLDEQLRDLD
jgi:cytochrome c-type biogenesis protein CcmH